jgi:competence protein ComEC
LAFLVRRRAVAFASALLIATAAIGFAVSSLKAALIAHPVLDRPAYGVTVTGFIELREERERSDRIVVNVVDIDGERLDTPLERVRLSVRRGTAPAVGSYVTLKARLNPPLPPLRPGGYDFARDLYFQRIGAIGFVTGAIKVEAPPSQPSFRVRLLSLIDGMRDGIDRHIRAVVPGDAGSIASALITGKRDALSASVNDAMYVSGLAHVLSISGYHMAVVAGVVFFVLRAGLALIPGVALRYPIKKWGAVAALVAATFYLVLSGAEVATQRSFIMIAIVLIGVMVDRAALTLRNLALAALAVMLVAPEAVVHPSFQMSFAATLALVAVYQGGVPWATSGKKASLGAQAASWGIREITTLVLASLIAGLATTPFAAFHFHRLAPYGVLANLLAMLDRIDLGHASRSPCAGRDAFRLRRAAPAFDGWRHRMDECDRPMGREPARRGRTNSRIWRRRSVDGECGIVRGMPAPNAIAVRRCCLGTGGDRDGSLHNTPRRDGKRQRGRCRGSQRQRPAVDLAQL